MTAFEIIVKKIDSTPFLEEMNSKEPVFIEKDVEYFISSFYMFMIENQHNIQVLEDEITDIYEKEMVLEMLGCEFDLLLHRIEYKEFSNIFNPKHIEHIMQSNLNNISTQIEFIQQQFRQDNMIVNETELREEMENHFQDIKKAYQTEKRHIETLKLFNDLFL